MKYEDTYTYIFGGGAIRGFAYIGAVKALNECGFKYNTLVGSSVGAIFATFYALGFSFDELKNLSMNVNFELFRDIRFSFKSNVAISKGNVFTQWLRECIEEKYYGDKFRRGKNKPVTFKDLEKDLIIYATDLNTFKCHEFSGYTTPDFEVAEAVKISCSMPGLFMPTEYENKKLADGDLLKGIPLWKNSDNLKSGENKIIEFRLEGEYDRVKDNTIDFFNAVYTCITDATTKEIIETYSDYEDVDYIKINTGDTVIIDFNLSEKERNDLILSGYNDTINALTKNILNKRKQLLKDYEIIKKDLIQLSDYIKSDKIDLSKMKLGELYINLSDIKSHFSSSIYDNINNFKTELKSSVPFISWFGKLKFKNKKDLIKNITSIVDNICIRQEKIKNYINTNTLIKHLP